MFRARAPVRSISLDGIDGAERIRDVRDGDDLGLRAEQLLEFIEQQFAAIVDGRDAQLRALLFAQHLPGHDVGVVLHGGDEHFIAGADVSAAVGLRHEVDGFGGAAHEDDFAAHRRVEESLHGHAAPLRSSSVARCGKEMHAAMDVGVVALVVVRDRLDDRAAASGRWRHCPDTPAAGRAPAAEGWGNRARTFSTSNRAPASAGTGRQPRATVGCSAHPTSSQFLPRLLAGVFSSDAADVGHREQAFD